MKDIDFDELDKAVTSLMGGVPTNDSTPRPDDGVKTLVIKTSQPLPDMPVVPVVSAPAPTPSVVAHDTPKPAADTVSAAPAVDIPKRAAPLSNRPAPSLATRRAGRFMDVMHPSSDMAKATTPAVSRHAGSIEPLNPAVVPETRPAAEPARIPEVTPVLEEHDNLSEWPDPLDLAQAQLATPAEEPIAPVEDDNMSAEEQVEPLVSPFLPDAKVEKRPLGGFAPDSQPDAGLAPSAEPAPAPQEDPQVPTEAVMLPEELQGDLMAIESSQADTTAPAATPSTAAATPQVAAAPERPASAPRPQPVGPSSIPQQYKESPSTGDATNGAIYDTDAYHQPLQHPVQKKPSWLWIVWIAGLLVIGAGGGAVAYLFLLK